VPVCSNCGHLNREGAKFCEECGFTLAARPPPQAKEQRKTVTVLFCDLTGSTELAETLDPERLRALLARYFERMKGIVKRHGGRVEKFIGDAVVAVFGVPVLHEDDALRALRAAAEMREALAELGLEGGIGVMTGEVVTGAEDWLAGDALNVAARLEQSAHTGEVLLGDPTLVLVRDAVEVEPLERLELKGKAAPVPAYRLLRVLDAAERLYETRFVGRERELGVVRAAWERARAGERCELVTLLGDAGIGKSRLAAEALASIAATIVRGRCLPYGEGITYWPVVEVLQQLDVRPTDQTAATAIRSLLGETDAVTSADEIAWAFRKTLEQAATERPLVVVVDDLHWGEETFLDLIEHVALLSSRGSILLLCLARPELLDRRPAWPITLRLEPLDDADLAQLMPQRIPAELREKITRAAGGNPLFIEEMVAMAGEADGAVVVPPTLQTLLAARLDQLESGERIVLERGAVEGAIFHRGAVQALAPPETQVTPRLAALVRKELIRPTKAQLAGEDGFRFRHLLIRDAAYGALPKAARAELHERFATWLEEHGAGLVELDEILGYHLEQACLYRAELGAPGDGALAAAARRRLAAAGGRALARADNFAAANLLERAAALMPPDELDIALENDLVFALFWAGKSDEALQRARSTAEGAAAAGDRVGELCGNILEWSLRFYLEPHGATERLAAILDRALPVFNAAGDDRALYIGYSALGLVASIRAQMDASRDAHEQAFVHAQRAGLAHLETGRIGTRFFGTTPVSELLAWMDEEEARGMPTHYLRRHRALCLAMLARFDESRALLAEQHTDLADRGGGIALGTTMGHEEVIVELLAGDPAAAAENGEEACRLLDEQGEKSLLSTAAGRLAQALYALDRLDEADAWAVRAAELGASEDRLTQMLSLQVRGKVFARRGEPLKAESFAREAVAIGEKTDMLNIQGDADLDLGEVLALIGRPDEAVAALEQAIECYERKGNLVSTQHARARLAEIGAQVRRT
jgi:class 3 adenylate cyclase/tetratricopeptide (TPR) repeat protein